ncbi:MAG: pyrrolo-quinoline quinone [Planctomycetota bacterium]|nr:MAG: pyrrolo-quinoline quinone [Planctomycetota bacterium]
MGWLHCEIICSHSKEFVVKRVVGLLSVVLFGAVSPLFAADWPQWRGPGGQGHSTAKNLPLTWSETENIAWRTVIPGRAWSSPVIDGSHIWLTTAVEAEASLVEKAKKLKDNFAGQPLNIVGKVSLRAVCVDRTSGKLLHDVELLVAESPDPVHQLNSFASPSPILEDGRLYAHFGTNGTACLDNAEGFMDESRVEAQARERSWQHAGVVGQPADRALRRQRHAVDRSTQQS